MEKKIPVFGCNNCGGRCSLYAHVEDGRITRMSTVGEKDSVCLSDPADQGNSSSLSDPPLTACIRGLNYHKTYMSDKRLRTPLLRAGKRGSGRFVPVSWDRAIEILTEEWIRIRDTYGPASRYVGYGWGSEAVIRPNALAKRLLALDGGYLNDYGNYSDTCTTIATPFVYGTAMTGSSYETLLQSKAILLWGHNPQETQFDHLMYYLKKCRKKGIPIYCIDPRRSRTVKALDARWIPVRPASDAALMDAMAYVIITEKLYDEEFVRNSCLGFLPETMPAGTTPEDSYFSYVLGKKDGIPKTPAWASPITGLSEEMILELARAYGQKPAALVCGYGMQRHACGEQNTRTAAALAALTGNVGIAGGWASGAGFIPSKHMRPSFPHIQNPVLRTISFFEWTRAADEGQIKMILMLAGNSLINQHSDINRTIHLLKDPSKVEFILCSDLFMTPSARYADLILPGISFLEMDNIVSPWERGNFIGYSNKAVQPLEGCRHEYEWLKEVASRLGLYDAFTDGHETTDSWLQDIYEDFRIMDPVLPPLKEFRKMGAFHYPDPEVHIAFADQRNDPARHTFPTDSGKIEIYSFRLAARHDPQVPAIPGYVPCPEGPGDPLQERYPLQLIGWHTIRRCHTIHETNEDMEKLDPQTLRMHPDDAAGRGILDGEIVRVFNDRGEIHMPVTITDDIRPGCIAMSQGAWYTPDQNGIDTRGSINVLTSQRPTPLARANPQHTNLAQVSRL